MRDQEFLLPDEGQLLWEIWWFSMYWLPSIVVASETGVLERLAGNPSSPGDLARELKLNERLLTSLLQVLASLNVVTLNRNGTYSLSEQARLYFVPGGPFHWYGLSSDRLNKEQYELLHRSLLNPDDTSTYPTLIDSWSKGEYPEESARTYAHLFHLRSVPFARHLAAAVDLKEAETLLDVGGGPGTYSIAFAEKNPHLRCQVLELPVMCRIAGENISERNLSGQVTPLSADMFHESWPANTDIVFFSNVLHDWGPEKCEELLRKAAASLKTGGRVLIHEMLFSEERPSENVTAASLSLMMALHGQGRQLSAGELREILEKSGFGEVSVTKARGPYSLISAIRKS